MSVKDTILDGDYFKSPNDYHLICGDIFELTVLEYLFRLADKDGQSYPSYRKLSQGLMSRVRCITACKTLEKKGYIARTRRANTSNYYDINYDKILDDIKARRLTVLTSKRG